MLKHITEQAVKDLQLNTSSKTNLELFKSLELSEEELRTLRLNEYFKPSESFLQSSNAQTAASSSVSVTSNSHSNSMKKKERKKFFTGEALEEEKAAVDCKVLKENLDFFKEI